MPLPTATATSHPTPAKEGADMIRRLTHQSARQMIQQVHTGLNVIWNSPDTAGVLAELGAEAAGVFDLNNKTITFLASILTGSEYEPELGKIMERVNSLPAFTVNGDGTVTLDAVAPE